MQLGNLTGNWSQRTTRIFDAGFATLVTALSVIGIITGEVEGSERPWDWFGIILVLGFSLPLFFRRTRPLLTLNIVSIFMMGFWIFDYATNFDTQLLFAIYAATAFGVDRRKTWINVGVIIVVTTCVAIIGVLVPSEDLPFSAVITLALIHTSGAFFGQNLYDRQLRLRSLERRAERAEAELEIRTQLAVVDERTRIAREMHDVVSHSMSVMVVQASAAQRVLDSNPEAAKEALAAVEATGRESLVEMRRMLGVLRDAHTETELTPQPEITNFEVLSQHCRDSGIPTEVTVIGDEISLSPGLRLASYRVIQEALTNVIKHAGRATLVNVKVEYGTSSLVISVADNGLGAATALTSDGAGHGIIGMRERVALYDGTFSAGPLDGGGYIVNATFPYEVASDNRVARQQSKNPFARTDRSA